MFIEALFTTAKMQKQPKCLSTKEWIKIWYIKRNNPTQRRTNTWITSMWNLKNKKICQSHRNRVEKYLPGTRAWEEIVRDW